MPQYVRAKIKGSLFFFTVVLADRSSCLLIDEIDRLRLIYQTVQQRRPYETIADFSTRWSNIKSGFSRGLNPMPRSASKVGKREKGIWQRRYWEHAIRDDADLERHVNYIHFNPVKHGHVTRVIDWPHSSFHRYVERGLCAADWGGDMEAIPGAFGE
jgi:putative transposase